MKTFCILSILSILSILAPARAQDLSSMGFSYGPQETPAQARARFEKEKADAEGYYKRFVPTDPYRLVNGRTNYAKGGDWRAFSGEVLSVHRDGVRVNGWYGPPGAQQALGGQEFFVLRFPYVVAERDYLPQKNWSALESGVHTYTTVGGGQRTIHQLDYGIPCDPPRAPEPTASQKLAAQILAENHKAAADAATLKFHLERAQAGDATSQYRLGELYLTGAGCDRDTNQARFWFQKAAAQGNADATVALAHLPRGSQAAPSN